MRSDCGLRRAGDGKTSLLIFPFTPTAGFFERVALLSALCVSSELRRAGVRPSAVIRVHPCPILLR
jgi:hypothetical protein